MTQPTSQITHYIPKWVLKKFRAPNLFELDIYTGSRELRSLDLAGGGDDLWPNDIEDRLSGHDNAAARIYREKIHGKDRILLTDSERQAFAMWMAHFYIRSPKRLINAETMLKNDTQNRLDIIELLHRDRKKSLEMIRANDPQIYADLVAEIGQDRADAMLLDRFSEYIRTIPAAKMGSAEDIKLRYMRDADGAKYAKILLGYEWVWLSSYHGFVISDDPLVSWHLASRRWEYGIAKEGVEITMPLTLNLCLCLQQHSAKRKTQLHPINKMEARLLNSRQRLSAIKYVYGNTPEILDFIKNPIAGWKPN